MFHEFGVQMLDEHMSDQSQRPRGQKRDAGERVIQTPDARAIACVLFLESQVKVYGTDGVRQLAPATVTWRPLLRQRWCNQNKSDTPRTVMLQNMPAVFPHDQPNTMALDTVAVQINTEHCTLQILSITWGSSIIKNGEQNQKTLDTFPSDRQSCILL